MSRTYGLTEVAPKFPLLPTMFAARVQTVGSDRGGHRLSEAKTLSLSQRCEIAEIARVIPSTWAVGYSSYTGQLSLKPMEYVAPCEAYMPGGRDAEYGRMKRRHYSTILPRSQDL